MKTHENSITGLLTKLSVILLLFVTVVSCTDRMAGLNKNLKGPTQQDLTVDAAEAKALLPAQETNIIASITWQFQLQRNLGPDIYAGYLMTPTPFAGNVNNVTYAIVDGWTNYIWIVPSRVMNAWLSMKKKGYDKKYPDLYAISLICKVLAASKAAAAFGPLPYSQYGEAATVPFDSPKEMYYAFFEDLDQAIQSLTKWENKDPNADQFRFASVDKSNYGGDYAKWIQVANTLKLRLALRISLVDPQKAQKEAEEAVNQQYGLIGMGDGAFVINLPAANPYYTITSVWGDIRLGAPVETILKGYDDPRLAKYALPAEDPAVNGKIKGIRQGIELPAKTKYVQFSQVNISENTPIKLIPVAESYFLRAEGALRGWNMGGTAGHFYKQGIRASFKARGLSVSAANTYMKNDTGVQIPYVDPLNPANNAPTLNHVTVKWEPGANFQTKLQKIIIQRWIASYPLGYVGWSLVRRTGYPKLYPVKINKSGGVIPDGEFIRRFPYTTVFTNASKAQVQTAVNKYLNGQNTAYQRLWWDVKGTGNCPGCRL